MEQFRSIKHFNEFKLFDKAVPIQRRTQDPVKHVLWSFLAKIVNEKKAVNYFRKNTPLQIFDRVLNTPRLLMA